MNIPPEKIDAPNGSEFDSMLSFCIGRTLKQQDPEAHAKLKEGKDESPLSPAIKASFVTEHRDFDSVKGARMAIVNGSNETFHLVVDMLSKSDVMEKMPEMIQGGPSPTLPIIAMTPVDGPHGGKGDLCKTSGVVNIATDAASAVALALNILTATAEVLEGKDDRLFSADQKRAILMAVDMIASNLTKNPDAVATPDPTEPIVFPGGRN